MAWFLYLLGAAWISIGSCAILYTTETRDAFNTILSNTNRKVLSAVPFAAGLLLLVSASACTYPWLIRLFGIMGLLKGVFIYVNPNDLYTKTIQWHQQSATEQVYRLFGIITIILGTAVLSWIV